MYKFSNLGICIKSKNIKFDIKFVRVIIGFGCIFNLNYKVFYIILQFISSYLIDLIGITR
jgi:hypothetical protein